MAGGPVLPSLRMLGELADPGRHHASRAVRVQGLLPAPIHGDDEDTVARHQAAAVAVDQGDVADAVVQQGRIVGRPRTLGRRAAEDGLADDAGRA